MPRYFVHPDYPLYLSRHNDDGSISGIPKDEANTDYQEYLAWVAEGNTAEEWSQDDAS